MSAFLACGDPVKSRVPLVAGETAVPAGSDGRVDRVNDLFNPASRHYEAHYSVRFCLDGSYVWAGCRNGEIAIDSSRERRSLLAGG